MSSRAPEGLEVAVVGMACRFPGAPSVGRFWANLLTGVESIKRYSTDELVEARVDPEELRSSDYVRARGALEDADAFDAALFGMSPAEAQRLDPQHRIFLECAWEALEDAAIDPSRFEGSIGVYAGASASSHLLDLLRRGSPVDTFQLMLANDKDYLATRVAYKLGLEGPSVAVQTACSTSLVAIHMACQALLSGECDVALAGGVNVHGRREGYRFQEGGIYSQDGHCRPFDRQASGTVPGSGAGIVVLRRREDAEADRQRVHALVIGSAINNDGARKVAFSAPSVTGQCAVIRAALAAADIDPQSIGFVEGHGTGTPIGDPIEIEALTRALGPASAERARVLGSVKGNIGHLAAAAGVAGFIKAVCAVREGSIPPTLHFGGLNPVAGLPHSQLRVNGSLESWRGPQPRRAGISSFGVGGTNAHVLIEEAPVEGPARSSEEPQLFVLSAATQGALDATADRLVAQLEHTACELGDVAWTLQIGRRALRHRRIAVASDLASAVAKLRSEDPTLTGHELEHRTDVAFLFPGQGSQYPSMAADLYENHGLVRAILDEGARAFRSELGFDPLALIRRDRPLPDEWSASDTLLVQPALFLVEYALARLWQSLGVQPQAMFGHSLGEYAAACIAGVMSLEQAIVLIAARARLLHELPRGAMLAVQSDASAVSRWLGGSLALAAENGPASVVVSGLDQEIAALEEQLRSLGIMCARLQTSHAFHSPMVEPVLAAFRAHVSRVSLRPPAIPIVSSLTGCWLSDADATDPDYWVQQMRGTVRARSALELLASAPHRRFVEVGPGRLVCGLLSKAAPHVSSRCAIATLEGESSRTPSRAAFLRSVGRLWLTGVDIRWEVLSRSTARRRVSLPTYPFERERFPLALPDLEARKRSSRDWLHRRTWEHLPGTPRVLAMARPLEGKRFLALGPTVDATRALLVRLVGAGAELIVDGERGPFAIDAFAPAARSELHDVWRKAAGPLDAVLVLAGWAPDATAEEGRRALLLLSMLAQHLGTAAPPLAREIVVVSDGVMDLLEGDATRPDLAMLDPLCRVISQEYPGLDARVIDVRSREPADVVAACAVRELLERRPLPLVAWREGRRWCPAQRPLGSVEESSSEPVLRPGGVYLITGGTGGVGLELAEQLASRHRAKLVLLGRAPAPAGSDALVDVSWIDGVSDLQGTPGGPGLRALEAEMQRFLPEIRWTDLEASPDGVADLESLCGLLVLRALADAGIHPAPGSVLSRAALAQRLGLHPDRERLFAVAIDALEASGIVTRHGDEIRFEVSRSSLADVENLTARIGALHPELGDTVKRLERCMRDLPEILADRIDGAMILHADDAARGDSLVDHAPTASSRRLHELTVASLISRLARRRAGTLRILEVGAGTGSLTSRVVPGLDLENAEYVISDLSGGFVRSTQLEAARRGYGFVSGRVLDIASDALAQGFVAGEFDLIIGLDVLHVATDLRVTLGHLKKLVRPGGAMLFIESVRKRRWVDLIWGTTRGWWAFDDEFRRDSPLLEAEEWESTLGALELRGSVHPVDRALRSRCDCAVLAIDVDSPRASDPSDMSLLSWLDADQLARSEAVERRIRRIVESGAEVLRVRGDVASEAQMRRAVSAALERFGRLNGIFHAAGEKVRSTLQAMSRREWEIQLRSKCAGVEALDAATASLALDFVVLMSSNSTLLGGLRMAGYPSAHAYLSAFAALRNRTASTRWLSIEWDNWWTERLQVDGSRALNTEPFMKPSEAMDVLERALAEPAHSCLLVSTTDLDSRVTKWVAQTRNGDSSRPAQSRHARPDLANAFVAPRTTLEGVLCELWGEALGIEGLGIRDNFFALGGDSMLTLQIAARATRRGVRLSPKMHYEHQTIEELSMALSGATLVEEGTLPQQGEIPLLPLQLELLEHGERLKTPPVLTLRIESEAARLSDASLQALVGRHEALRMQFRHAASGWLQERGDRVAATCVRLDLAELPESEHAAILHTLYLDLGRTIDVSRAPLIRLCRIERGAGLQPSLILIVHHLIADATSLRILRSDIERAWESERIGSAWSPGPAPGYGEWARKVDGYLSSGNLDSERSYWLEELVRARELRSSGDTSVPGSGSVRRCALRIDPDLWREVMHKVVPTVRVTVEEVLRAAVALALHRSWARGWILAEVEGDARDAELAGGRYTESVGWLTTRYSTLWKIPEGGDAIDTLVAIRDRTRGIPQEGIGFALLERVGVLGARAEMPAPDVRFEYLGMLPSSSRWKGQQDGDSAPAEADDPIVALRCSGEDGGLHLELRHRLVDSAGDAGVALLERVRECLEAFVSNCAAPKVMQRMRAEQFPAARIDPTTLDRLLSRIGERRRDVVSD